jgi:hypothetical protein
MLNADLRTECFPRVELEGCWREARPHLRRIERLVGSRAEMIRSSLGLQLSPPLGVASGGPRDRGPVKDRTDFRVSNNFPGPPLGEESALDPRADKGMGTGNDERHACPSMIVRQRWMAAKLSTSAKTQLPLPCLVDEAGSVYSIFGNGGYHQAAGLRDPLGSTVARPMVHE